MGWVLIRNEDGAYVAPPGTRWSYTFDIRKAVRYASREEAEANACGNERPARVEGQLRQI